jgi:predicted permease
MRKDQRRGSWRNRLMDGVAQDVRFALRMLSKHRQSTVLMTFTLAFGIGANTAVFTAAKAWLINPYPFPTPERLVRLEARHVRQGVGAHYRDFLDWRERNRAFEEIAIFSWRNSVLTGRTETERVTSYVTTAGAVRVLGVGPVLGRFFSEQEDAPGGARVALVSHAAWQRRFGGRPDILGAAAVLDGQPHTIVGVMPDHMVLPGMPRPDFWLPLRENPAGPRVGQQYYSLLARLKPRVTLAQARMDMAEIARALEREYPDSNRGWGVVLTLASAFIRDKAITPLTVIIPIAGGLLVLVLANVAGVLLAQASGRTRELAVRAALGAGRWRIVRQLLTESVLLAVLGGALGLVVARWLVQIVQTVVPNRGLDAALRLDAPALLVTFAFSVLSGLVCGLSPALRYRKADLHTALKGMHASGPQRSRTRLLSGLVVAQVAVSMVLLVGGGLLSKDFLYLLTVDTGVKTDGVVTFRLELPRHRYASDEQRAQLVQQVVERLQATPGVDSAAAVGTLPMSGYKTEGRFEIEPRAEGKVTEGPRAILNASTPGYFGTLAIPLLQGRDFDDRDRVGAPAVAIINERLVRRYFPGQGPVGARITLADRAYTVVGVVGSVRHEGPWREAAPEIYLPFANSPTAEMFFVARSGGDLTGLVTAIRQSVREIDAALFVDQLRPMKEVIQDSLGQPRLLARGLLAFALFGLALSGIGLYGVIAYSTAQRTREIAIRVAVGATSGQVLRLVLWNGFRLAGLGLVLGIPLALGLSQMLKRLLVATSAHDILVFIGVSLGLLAVALAATYIPARRATRVDPLAALGCE